jgi:amino acid transporter
MAYALFMMSYTPQKFRIPGLPTWLLSAYFLVVLITLPLSRGEVVWYSYSTFFDLIAFLMIFFVFFMNLIKFKENKSMESFLVTTSFLFLSLFHFLHIFSFTSEWMYVFAHISMIASFLSLLSVVIRVKNK